MAICEFSMLNLWIIYLLPSLFILKQSVIKLLTCA